jgi:hypothetical protein
MKCEAFLSGLFLTVCLNGITEQEPSQKLKGAAIEKQHIAEVKKAPATSALSSPKLSRISLPHYCALAVVGTLALLGIKPQYHPPVTHSTKN